MSLESARNTENVLTRNKGKQLVKYQMLNFSPVMSNTSLFLLLFAYSARKLKGVFYS